MRTGLAAASAALVMVLALLAANAIAAPAPAPTSAVQVQSLPPPASANPAATSFDAAKATNAYLARVSGEARKRSDSYFEGGYVLILVDGLYAVAVAALLLWAGISARMRNIAVD